MPTYNPWPSGSFNIPKIGSTSTYYFPDDPVYEVTEEDYKRTYQRLEAWENTKPTDQTGKPEPIVSDPKAKEVKKIQQDVPPCSKKGTSIVSFLSELTSQSDQWIENGNNPNIIGVFKSIGYPARDDKTAWCMAFVNYTLKNCGYKYTGELTAVSIRSNKTCTLITDKVDEITKLGQPGDIILQWPGKANQAGTGHVQFLYAINSTNSITTVGGNEGDPGRLKLNTWSLGNGKYMNGVFRELWRPSCE